MSKIYAPNKEYTGVSAGIPFVKGVGETDKKHLIEWFKSKGYEVDEETQETEIVDNPKENEETPENKDIPENPDLNKTVYTEEELKGKDREELMKIAEGKNLTVHHNTGVDKIIKQILESQK